MAPEFALALWGFAALMALLMLRAPIALSMMLAGAGGYWFILDQNALLNYLKTTPYHLFANYTLSIIPLFILMGALAERGGFDALIALGCIIRGETYHFELVANESGAAVTRVALDYRLPIANAILTTEDLPQALARQDEKGRDAAKVAIEMARLLQSLAP